MKKQYKNRVSPEKEEQILGLWRAGRLLKQIIWEAKVGHSTVYKVLSRLGVKADRNNCFSTQKQLDLFEEN